MQRIKNIFVMEKGVKIGIIALLLLCLLSVPADFYQLTRFILVALFSIMAYNAHTKANVFELGFYVAMVFLFQPFVEIPLGIMGWKIVHIGVAAILAGSFFIGKKKQKEVSVNQ